MSRFKPAPYTPPGELLGSWGIFTAVLDRPDDGPAVVEVYDNRHSGPGFSTRGQLIRSYFATTLLEFPGAGLYLGDPPEWRMAADQVLALRTAVERATRSRAALLAPPPSLPPTRGRPPAPKPLVPVGTWGHLTALLEGGTHVKIFDRRFSSAAAPFGQLVRPYEAATLLDHHGGLDLSPGTAEWRMSADVFQSFHRALEAATRCGRCCGQAQADLCLFHAQREGGVS